MKILNLFINILRGLRAWTVQFYTEANVKNGLQFAASSYFTGLTAGEHLDTIIITGDKPVIIKAQYTGIRDGGDVMLNWYENPTYSSLGDDLAQGVYNQTEISPELTTIQLYGVTPADPTTGNYAPDDTSKPVITDTGTKIQPTLVTLGITGQGSSDSSRNTLIGLDHILAPNTTYLLRRTSVSACSGLFGYTTWYEGEPDLPRKEFN
jgi:hypothetical protein|tara:strand:+ start:7976 stop:8599 length:624 start_codon:yes stop_codon:yes gene_type:complete